MISVHGGGGINDVRASDQAFHGKGMATLVFDAYEMQGFTGRSSGFWALQVSNEARQRMLLSTAWAAYQWAITRPDIDARRIYFFGISNGAAVVANLAAMVDPAHVRGIIAETGIPPELLSLEITESMTMADPDRAAQVLHRLRDLGVLHEERTGDPDGVLGLPVGEAAGFVLWAPHDEDPSRDTDPTGRDNDAGRATIAGRGRGPAVGSTDDRPNLTAPHRAPRPALTGHCLETAVAGNCIGGPVDAEIDIAARRPRLPLPRPARPHLLATAIEATRPRLRRAVLAFGRRGAVAQGVGRARVRRGCRGVGRTDGGVGRTDGGVERTDGGVERRGVRVGQSGGCIGRSRGRIDRGGGRVGRVRGMVGRASGDQKSGRRGREAL
jgi:hypothetical protein